MLVHELINQGAGSDIAIVDHERRFTYDELKEAVKNCRNRLYAEGVKPGDRVAIFSRNSAEFVFVYMAVASLGAISIPINFQLSNREIAYIIKDAGARFLVTYELLNLVDALATLRCDIRLKQIETKNIGSPKAGLEEAPSFPSHLDEHAPCVIIYTSGTTGNPKGAVLSHRNLVANCEQIVYMGCKPECNVLCVLPMYHCFGWTCAVLYPMWCGATVVILDSFTPKETIKTIREEKLTDMYVVPSICSLLTKLATKEDMASMRLVVSGGTTLPLKIAEDFMEKFGLEICEGYGLSETSPVVTMNPPGAAKVGSSGVPVHNIEIRIVDPQSRDVPQGEPGELICRGENVMLGYWNLPEASGDALRGGWFHTADVARIDEDGYVYIVDRIKDMIISMGENIYPREVEEVVYQFPGIAEAAVIGIEDKLRGQAGACFYSLHEGASVNIRELKKFLQENLALYKIPREFHELPHLPRTSTGKIAKRMILEEFQKNK